MTKTCSRCGGEVDWEKELALLDAEAEEVLRSLREALRSSWRDRVRHRPL